MFVFGLFFMVLACLVAGYFFTLLALVAITLAVIVAWLYLNQTMKEGMPAMIPLAFAIVGAFALIGMWGMYYLTTGQTDLQDFLARYLLR